MKRVLTTQEAAEYMGIAPKSVRDLFHKGRLPRVMLSRRLLFDVQDLDKLVDEAKKGGEISPHNPPGRPSRGASGDHGKPYEWAKKYGVHV